MVKRLMVAVVLAGALAGGACAGAFQQPEVRFDGVRIGGLGLRGGLLYAQIHVANPNRFGFETSSMSYDLEMRAPDDGEGRWVRIAQGVFDESVRVGARDSVLIEVPIDFTYASLGGALQSVLDQGSVGYRVEGVVQLREPVRRSLPYRRVGVMALSGSR
jgi:LEA14-like dessication related protein